MTNTFENIPCTFQTLNTRNDKDNSTYTITKNVVKRHAPINTDRKPDQVENEREKNIIYLDPNGEGIALLKKSKDGDSYRVTQVNGDTVIITFSKGGVVKNFDGSRIPQEGLRTFDFINNNGVMSRLHFGHEVINLVMPGPPPPPKKSGCCIII